MPLSRPPDREISSIYLRFSLEQELFGSENVLNVIRYVSDYTIRSCQLMSTAIIMTAMRVGKYWGS